LIIHGSRDPRPHVALDQLARLFYDRLATLASANSSPVSEKPSLPLVGTGLLELGPTSLDEQIRQFGEDTLSTGLNQVQLLPLFLLPGVHVMEDIPAAVKSAEQSLGEKVQIKLRPHLGVHQGLIRLLTNQMATLPVESWILLAHGSRRRGGNAPIEAIAQALTSQSASRLNHLTIIPAYWSVSPTLEMQVTEFVAAGYKQIGVLPYFLFPGSTTDAIAEEVERLSYQFPQVMLKLAEPLNPNSELVNLILDLAQLP
jgi:sirohydrochlorin ferrochelatase